MSVPIDTPTLSLFLSYPSLAVSEATTSESTRCPSLRCPSLRGEKTCWLQKGKCLAGGGKRSGARYLRRRVRTSINLFFCFFVCCCYVIRKDSCCRNPGVPRQPHICQHRSGSVVNDFATHEQPFHGTLQHTSRGLAWSSVLPVDALESALLHAGDVWDARLEWATLRNDGLADSARSVSAHRSL